MPAEKLSVTQLSNAAPGESNSLTLPSLTFIAFENEKAHIYLIVKYA